MYSTIRFNTTIGGVVDITEQVREYVKQSGVQNGFCIVHDPHTTASVGIGSKQEGFKEDFMLELDKMFPATLAYHHVETPFDAAGHVKTAIVGANISVIIKDGDLVLSDEQGIFFYEFDGPRMRKVLVKAVGAVH